jgi:ribosomal protein L19
MRRDYTVYFHNFAVRQRLARPLRAVSLKNRLVSLTKYEELEYIYTTEGRCSSHRSRGKMSSILVRNKKYGVEQRFFLFNPRLILRYR